MTTEDSILNLSALEPNSDTSELSDLNKEIAIRKKLLPDYFPVRSEVKMASKMVQVSLGDVISDDNSSDSTGNYWRIFAEKKRIELKEALDENETLCNQKELLMQQLKENKKLLEEMSTFIDVFKTEALDAANDTGIDVGDDSSE